MARPRAYMDALGSASSESDESAEGGDGVERARAARERVTAPVIDYEALRRRGLREARLGRASDASAAPAVWSRGERESGGTSAYWGSESEKTRDAVGVGLSETCARALRAAREKEREREAELARRREEAALAKERHLEAKRALREDDVARRRREREETRGSVEEAGDGFDAKRSRRAPRIDLSTREVPAVDDEGAGEARDEDGEDDAVDRETRLVETGGFDFGADDE